MSNKVTYILLSLIVSLSIFFRFWKLDQVPASLNWDEVAAGYNGFTIANWGMDEYGYKFPIVFKSFADDKHPVHIYITAIIIKIFGLSDYATRSSSALMGVLTVIVFFILIRELLKDNLTALFGGLFMAVSPYSIHFSRGLWENNFALFFLVAGLAVFFVGIRKKNFLLPLSFFLFGLSFFSYHSAKVVVPIVVLFVCLSNLKLLLSNKTALVVSVLVTLIFGILIIKDTRILGFARINQTKLSSEVSIIDNYRKHFTYSYLFNEGDQGPRASVKVVGQFYKLDLILFLVGLIALIIKKKWQVLSIILIWLVLSPIPSSVSTVEPSAIRGIFMIGPILLLSAVGASSLVTIFKNKIIKTLIIFIILGLLTREVINYANYYFKTYSIKEAIEWQYGMKEMVLFSKNNSKIYKMYVDNIRQQPYIYFLYYQKFSLPEFLRTVKYDESNSKSFNTVSRFDRYQFGGWNIIDSYPNEGILYAITPSYFTGLKYAPQFDVLKLIKYPNKSDAFYIVGGHAQ